MIELELFLDNTAWNQSWLLNPIDISTETEKFSGVVISETLEKVDIETIRCVLTVTAELPEPPQPIPSVITSNTNNYPTIKRLRPSAGTSWPIPENSELLVSFIQDNPKHALAIGSLYNKNKTDPVKNTNTSQHILRANTETEFIINDECSALSFKHEKNNINLTQNLDITSSAGNIFLQSAQNMMYHSEQDTHETTEKNYIRHVSQYFKLGTHIGNIELDTEKNITVQANKNIILNSTEKLSIVGHENLNLISQEQLSLLSQNNAIISSKGNLTLHSDQALVMIADESITLVQNGNRIEITKDAINITAPQVSVSGQTIVSVKPTSPA